MRLDLAVLQNSYSSAYYFFLFSISVICEPLFHVFIFMIAKLEIAVWLASADKILVQVISVLSAIPQTLSFAIFRLSNNGLVRFLAFY